MPPSPRLVLGRYPDSDLTLAGRYRFRARDADGRLVHESARSNVIEINGKIWIAQWLNGEVGVNPQVYGSVATGGGPYSGSETAMTGEVQRVPLATQSRSANALTWTFFWPSRATASTLASAGVWLNGALTLGSGNLLSLVPFAYTWAANQTLTLQFTLTVG